MAGRKAGFRHNEETRAKIQTTLIIKRLMDHVTSPKPIMDASQVNAAKALLNKALPDLSAVSMDANVSGDVTMTFKTVYEDKP
jgi:hypothetical protein